MFIIFFLVYHFSQLLLVKTLAERPSIQQELRQCQLGIQFEMLYLSPGGAIIGTLISCLETQTSQHVKYTSQHVK